MYKTLHVYDLDGVLVDSSHRYRNTDKGTIDLAHWRANRTPDRIALDTLLPMRAQYIDDVISPHVYVILCTAREYTPQDFLFIRDTLGMPNKLIMRPHNNTEADAILKRRQLQRLFNLRQFQSLPRKLWEDNPRNIDALRDLFTSVYYVQSNQGA